MDIRGIKVLLSERKKVGLDPLGAPIYEETLIEVDNVLVAPATQDDVVGSINLDGTKTTYALCVPKGDENDWRDKDVYFLNKKWHTYTNTIEWIEDMVPLHWNKKVLCEMYE